MYKFKSIKNKIVVILFPITILAFMLVCVLTLIQNSYDFNKDMLKEINLTTELVNSRMSTSMSETLGIMNNVKHSVENGDTTTEGIEKYIYTIADIYPETIPTGIYCGLENGTYIDKLLTPEDPTWVMKERPWYIEGCKADEVSFGETYMDSMTGSYIVSVYTNLKDKNDNLLGVISADIPIDTLANIMENQTLLETGYIYAIDLYSGMVFGNKVDKDLNGVFISETDNDFLKEIESCIKNNKFDEVIEYENYYYSLQRVDNTNFVTVSVVPKVDLTNTLQVKAFRVVVISIVGIVILLSAMYLLLTLCLKPISKITSTLDSLCDLDLTIRNEVKTRDEFGRILDNINKLSDILQGLIRNIKTMTIDIEKVSENTIKGANDITGSTKQQSNAMHNLSSTMDDLTKSIDNIAGGATQLAQEVNEVVSSVNVTETQVKETLDNVKEGSLSIDSMQNGMTSIMGISNELQTSVMDLRNGLKGINDMVNIIMDIAEQTNLLSLNASIEAARAGEQGKGFAVVAGEIRSLSDSCQRSVTNIVDATSKLDSLVDTVYEKANLNLSIINDNSTKANNVKNIFEIIQKNVHSINNITERISEAIKNVDTVSSDMAAATEEQTASTEVVLNMCNGINKDSTIIEQQTNDILAISKDLNDTAKELTNSVCRFNV